MIDPSYHISISSLASAMKLPRLGMNSRDVEALCDITGCCLSLYQDHWLRTIQLYLGAKHHLRITWAPNYCLLQVYQTSTGLDRSFTWSQAFSIGTRLWLNVNRSSDSRKNIWASAYIRRDMNSFPSLCQEGKIGKKGVGVELSCIGIWCWL